MSKLASQVCPVCKGEKKLTGRTAWADGYAHGTGTATIWCDECGGIGVVPAEGDLAQWREEAEHQLDEIAARAIATPKGSVVALLGLLRIHLAAMPQAEQGAAG